MCNLKDLTLIVPTYNRQNYIIRQINYWSETDVTLHILDGSNESIDELEFLSRSKNIFYHNIKTSFEHRMGYASSLITTKYAALLSDDEFFIPSSIEKCIKIIENNNLVSCKGSCFTFNYIEGKVVGSPAYAGMRGYKIDAQFGKDRMIQHMAPYNMYSLWSIMKSDVMKSCLNAMGLTGKLSCAASAEIQVSLITSYLGSIEIIDDLFWLRSQENNNIWWEDGNISFAKWYSGSNYQDEVKHFLEITAEVLSQKDGNSKKEILDNLKIAINHYIKTQGLSLKIRKKYNQALSFLKYSIKLYLPKFDYLVKKILNKPPPNFLLSNIKRMFDVSSVNEAELRRIINMIEKTHKL